MGPNRKRRKRLLIALAAVMLLGGLLGAAYLVREHQLETRAEAGRIAGPLQQRVEVFALRTGP